MEKKVIEFNRKVKIGEKEITSMTLDFDKVTGQTFLDAEKQARARGDQSPAVMFSLSYQTVLASKLSDLSFAELTKLPGDCFSRVIAAVNNFLFA